ncbi:MAG: SOS response-associated peptidase [Acidimicrobiia bacterium]|nr:SOS response-associated peptidase [Acidimicrobiia bacterium]
MCGRFVSTSSPTELAEQFVVDEVAVANAEPNYNVAPRAKVMVVRERSGDERSGGERSGGERSEVEQEEHRVLSRVRWGLVPSWAKDPGIGDRLINARAETVAEKPAYRSAFAKRRCIIPVDGFYEWKVVGPPSSPKGRPKKQPIYIRRRDDEPMAFAGLWEAWKVPEGVDAPDDGDGWLRSCVIVTTGANALLAPVHDRMPVVLPASAWGQWLDPGEHDRDALGALLAPAPDEWFEAHPVSTRVNRVVNNDPGLLTPVPAEPMS